MSKTGVDHFCNELDRLVDRFRFEYDMLYAEIVGCLFMKAHSLVDEAKDPDDEGEGDESPM